MPPTSGHSHQRFVEVLCRAGGNARYSVSRHPRLETISSAKSSNGYKRRMFFQEVFLFSFRKFRNRELSSFTNVVEKILA